MGGLAKTKTKRGNKREYAKRGLYSKPYEALISSFAVKHNLAVVALSRPWFCVSSAAMVCVMWARTEGLNMGPR
ncbi:hypothetical protein R1flu_008031 [Riccia fluitans]|uniref:Uncharacterized protein n=1 Tax=Riccia fluitans TaxID=41844 RepID=A0ABD1YAL8_9MARC